MSDKTDEFMQLFAMWRNDGLTPLTFVKGYAELLLEGIAGDLTDQQRKFVEIIYRNCLRAATLWHHPTEYLRLCFKAEEAEWKAIHLADSIQEALTYLHEYAQIDDVEVNLPETLPSVRGNHHLSSVFTYLIDPNLPLDYSREYPMAIEVNWGSGSTVVVQIRTGIRLCVDGLERRTDFFYPGSRPSIADLIVRQHGSRIRIRSLSDGTEFEFSLQIWDGDQAHRARPNQRLQPTR